MKFSVRRIALIGLFLALLVIGARIQITVLPPVPFTLQTAVVLLAATLLGGVDSFVVVTLYIAMGLIGLPVFVTGGGVAYLSSPTFGFTLGFAAAGLITGALVGRRRRPPLARLILAVVAGTLILYLIGVVYYCLLQCFYFGRAVDVWRVILTFWVIFIPTDIIKGVVVVVLTRRLAPVVCRGEKRRARREK